MDSEVQIFKSTGAVTRTELLELARTDHDRALTLVIAGIDSGGGAGLTADCISVHDAGAFALCCPTALTVQSLERVGTVQSVDPKLFKETLDTLVSDFPNIKAVKVGLICSQELLDLTLDYLEGPLHDAKVVWDPVLTATAGNFESADLKKALPRILKQSTVFTPNLNEALALASWDRAKLEQEGIVALAKVFTSLAPNCAVLIKGGHGDEHFSSKDLLLSVKDKLCTYLSHERKAGQGAHGGGCALSSSIAASLALGYAVCDAVALGKSYVTCGIMHPDLKSEGARPPVGHHENYVQGAFIPDIDEDGFPKKRSSSFAPCPQDLGFYPVLDSYEWVEFALKCGVKTLQLRIKDSERPDLYKEIEAAVKLARSYEARLFIDDYYELAIKAGAYGVHLGMEDLRKADLELISKAKLRLGVSTHGPYELMKALSLKPSYVALGHIFPTNTKAMPSKPQGLWKLSREVALIKSMGISATAIGGITLKNANVLRNMGLTSAAVVTAVTKAYDPKKAIEKWLEIFGSGGSIPQDELNTSV